MAVPRIVLRTRCGVGELDRDRVPNLRALYRQNFREAQLPAPLDYLPVITFVAAFPTASAAMLLPLTTVGTQRYSTLALSRSVLILARRVCLARAWINRGLTWAIAGGVKGR